MTKHGIRFCVATCLLGLLGGAPAGAQQPWAGQTFLSDYSKIQPMPGSGMDFAYIAPDVESRAAIYTKVMIDAPEVFISPESPYKGAKAEDLAAIAGLVRGAATSGVEKRGYRVVDKPGPDVIYIRMAVTDLQIAKKKRGLLAYTPVGFVVDAGKKAMQDFVDKYDVLDLALQTEVQDSVTGDVLAASVLKRGKSAGVNKPLSFDVMVNTADALGDRMACRLDNSKVPAAQRIDCTDDAARESRPKVVGK